MIGPCYLKINNLLLHLGKVIVFSKIQCQTMMNLIEYKSERYHPIIIVFAVFYLSTAWFTCTRPINIVIGKINEMTVMMKVWN